MINDYIMMFVRQHTHTPSTSKFGSSRHPSKCYGRGLVTIPPMQESKANPLFWRCCCPQFRSLSAANMEWQLNTEHETGVVCATALKKRDFDHKRSRKLAFTASGVWVMVRKFLERSREAKIHILQVKMCASSIMIQGVMCTVCRQVLWRY